MDTIEKREKVKYHQSESKRDVIDLSEISPESTYPLKAGAKLMLKAYQTCLNEMKLGTFPIPYKKLNGRLTVLRGSDIITYLNGGDWVTPKKPALRAL